MLSAALGPAACLLATLLQLHALVAQLPFLSFPCLLAAVLLWAPASV